MTDVRPERTSARDFLRKFCTRLIVVWRGPPQSRLLSTRKREPRSVMIMKKPIVLLSLLLLAMAAPCSADNAPNPFIKNPDGKPPAAPPGVSFASLLENILVPPDLLDDWLQEHPMKEDATELRAAVQAWVVEGKAKLDHTVLILGTAGRKTCSNLVLEKTYPTEFTPSGVGVWPMPTAFDTRNLGQDMQTGVSSADDVPTLWSNAEFIEMVSSDSWQQLVERTRQPNDVFLPHFRSKRITKSDPAKSSKDPFAPPVPASEINFNNPPGLIFKPDFVQLASRFDPVFEGNPNDNLSRLSFYRGSIAAPMQEKSGKATDVSRLSVRTIRVPLLAFSSWLQGRSPLAATTESWEAAEGWRKAGKAHSIGELFTRVTVGTKTTLENVEEYIYPTEWEPMDETEFLERWEEGKKLEGKDGVATMKRMKVTPLTGADAASLPTAFDTRNIGTSVNAVLSNGDQGLVLSCEWDRVLHLDDSVYHRIKVDEEWIPNVKMPLFSATKLTADLRMQPGQWTLLGEVCEFLKTGILDREHCLLVFVKVE